MTDALREQLQAALGAGYVIDRELGGGGMSRVFVARDARLARDIVVKMLAPDLAADISAERFTREIRLAATLQEPHIVPVLADGVTASGLPYYTMPFVEGASLRERLRVGHVPVTDAVSILRDVAKALAYAHARGIVHRDIKPDNILLSSGTAVVTDFGIAKALEVSRTQTDMEAGALTRTGTSLGTPAYMAPEQAAGDPNTDQRADIYAWGVVAYELLTGAHPFASRTTPQQLLAAHMTETPELLSMRASEVPAGITALVMRALAKDPSARPASAAELLSALDAIGPSPLSMSRIEVRWPRVIAASAVFALLLVAGYVWKRPQRISAEPADVPVMMAVLPFDHEGPDDQRPFTNGLTDAITAKLTALRSLAVIDRRSAATYRGTTKPTQKIGAELRVKYLLTGVVRWAKDGTGAMRAQVIPTLVDAATGTNKWSGEPTDVTLDDPFTAQATIATNVASALQLVLQPSERARLARRFSDDPQAFAAFQHGVALQDLAVGTVGTADNADRANQEFERAVALDSGFVEAWAHLVAGRLLVAASRPEAPVTVAQLRKSVAEAQRFAPDDPMVLMTGAWLRFTYDRDTTAVDALVGRAVDSAPNDAVVLTFAAKLRMALHQRDSALALVRRAASLDPRSALALMSASDLALQSRNWETATSYANAVIALDSTRDEGWGALLAVALSRGDTLGMQGVLAKLLKVVPALTGDVAAMMAYSGTDYGKRYVDASARALGVQSFVDSVLAYYDTKADVYLRLGDKVRSQVMSDSIVRLMKSRTVNGTFAGDMLVSLAFAQANLGRSAEARASLARGIEAARPYSHTRDATDVLQPVPVAGVYAMLGEHEKSVQWLEASYDVSRFGETARALAMHPKLQALRGTPALQRFLTSHPE